MKQEEEYERNRFNFLPWAESWLEPGQPNGKRIKKWGTWVKSLHRGLFNRRKALGLRILSLSQLLLSVGPVARGIIWFFTSHEGTIPELLGATTASFVVGGIRTFFSSAVHVGRMMGDACIWVATDGIDGAAQTVEEASGSPVLGNTTWFALKASILVAAPTLWFTRRGLFGDSSTRVRFFPTHSAPVPLRAVDGGLG